MVEGKGVMTIMMISVAKYMVARQQQTDLECCCSPSRSNTPSRSAAQK